MRQSNGVLQVIGEMIAIVILALTARFVGFAQTTLESGAPLTVERAFSYFMDLLSVFTRVSNAGAAPVCPGSRLAHSHLHCLGQPFCPARSARKSWY